MNAKVKLVDFGWMLRNEGKSQRQDPGSKTEPGEPSASVQTVSERSLLTRALGDEKFKNRTLKPKGAAPGFALAPFVSTEGRTPVNKTDPALRQVFISRIGTATSTSAVSCAATMPQKG